MGTTASGTAGHIRATNDIIAYHSSDARLKDNVEVIENALEKIDAIRGVSFDWVAKEGIHEHEGRDVGIIAQEIAEVLPEIVTTRENGYMAVKYDKIVALLIQAIKELDAKVK